MRRQSFSGISWWASAIVSMSKLMKTTCAALPDSVRDDIHKYP